MRTRRPRAPRARRAIAMILVVVALATATVLTTSYVASRDASPEIGRRAEDASDSMWGARSAANLAVAILQTEMRWSDNNPDRLIESMRLAGADVEIVVTDLEGNPPDADDLDLIVTAKASAGGFETTAQKIVSYRPPVPIGEAFDPMLKEFAVYARTSLDLNSKSSIGVWPASPTPASFPKVGLGFVSSSDIKAGAPTCLIMSEIYVSESATAALRAMTTDAAYRGGAVLPVAPPAVEASVPSAFSGLPHPYAPLRLPVPQDVDWEDVQRDLLYGRYDDVSIEEGSVVTLDDAPQGIYAVDELYVDNGSTLVIKGDVHLGVAKLRIASGSTIELADENSSLTIYIAEQMDIDNAAIGAPRAWARTNKSVRSVSDVPYLDPSRITIMTVGSGKETLRVRNGSAAVAQIHAPSAELSLESGAALFGRATADVVKLNDAVVGYDPGLDARSGFTNLDGPLYGSDGGLLQEVVDLIAGLSVSSTLDSLFGAIADLSDAVTPDGGVVLTQDDPPSPRDPDRAVGRDWPGQALSIELAQSEQSLNAGDFFAVREVTPTSESLDDSGAKVVQVDDSVVLTPSEPAGFDLEDK